MKHLRLAPAAALGAGLALVTAGVWQVYEPAGLITLGSCLVGVAYDWTRP